MLKSYSYQGVTSGLASVHHQPTEDLSVFFISGDSSDICFNFFALLIALQSTLVDGLMGEQSFGLAKLRGV